MPKQTIESEVSGVLVKIERAVGDEVAPGDVVMVLESMKMEIPVEAPHGGVLSELLVDENVSVDEGTALFVVES